MEILHFKKKTTRFIAISIKNVIRTPEKIVRKTIF